MNSKMKKEVQNSVNGIWQENEEYIRKICRYKLASAPEYIEDCVQDVYLDLLDAASKEQEIANPKSWLTVVANNKIKDLYSKLKRERVRLVEFTSENIDSIYSADVCDEAFKHGDEQILMLREQVMQSLSVEQRQLIHDRYTLKKSIEQIATEHGTTENNIYQKLFRVRQKTKLVIKKMLEDEI